MKPVHTDLENDAPPFVAASQPQQPRTLVDGYKIGLINAMHPTRGQTDRHLSGDGRAHARNSWYVMSSIDGAMANGSLSNSSTLQTRYGHGVITIVGCYGSSSTPLKQHSVG